jgi:tetratricopeptide (TPR) repeat protein
MLTIGAYDRYVKELRAQGSRTKTYYAAVMVFLALGLMAKSMVATLPFVLLLLDYWPLGRMHDRREFFALLREKIPLFVVSVGACLVAARMPGLLFPNHIPLTDRVGNAVVSYVVYLGQMICPMGLACLYPVVPGGPPAWTVLLAFALLAAITAGVVAWRKKCPCLLTGWLWYLGMMFPVIGIIQISGDAAHADRYLYLPGIGLTIAGTWAAAEWCAGLKYRQPVTAGLMLGAIGVLIALSRAQTSFWRDSKSLWTHALACTSGNFIAHNNLGSALAMDGNFEEAAVQFRNALQVNPSLAEAHRNLGIIFDKTGHAEEAISELQQATDINPNFSKAFYNLGAVLFEKGDTEAAIAKYSRALEITPDYAEAMNNLGIALYGKGEKEKAIALYRQALDINPDYPEALGNLGVALFDKGEKEEAIAQYRRAVKIRPDYAEALGNLGVALLDKGEREEAIAQYRKALESDPKYVKAEYNWGGALASEGKLDEAIAHFRHAVKIKPDYALAYSSLGLVCFEKGETREAVSAWQQALQVKPDQADIQNNLAWVLATASEASVRDGAKAVALAERASQLNGGRNAAVLHTLAAAYAEAGRFEDATATARHALELATAEKDNDLTAKLPGEIKLYEAHTPARDVPR